MKLVAYIRCSTSKQDLGLSVQKEGISAYAKLYGHELVETIEEQVSAKNLQRDGLKKALGMVEAGTVDAIIIYKIDRISRSVADLASIWLDKPHLGIPSSMIHRHLLISHLLLLQMYRC